MRVDGFLVRAEGRIETAARMSFAEGKSGPVFGLGISGSIPGLYRGFLGQSSSSEALRRSPAGGVPGSNRVAVRRFGIRALSSRSDSLASKCLQASVEVDAITSAEPVSRKEIVPVQEVSATNRCA